MRETFLPTSILLVLVGLVVSVRPSEACGSCTCQNVQSVIVVCAACDTELTTYPPQKAPTTAAHSIAQR
jgi:hypothetical protein